MATGLIQCTLTVIRCNECMTLSRHLLRCMNATSMDPIYPIYLIHPIPSYPILYYPILSYPILPTYDLSM